MKKRIIIGVCAVVCLLSITPVIPAQHYMQMKEHTFHHQLDNAIAALRNMDKDDKQREYTTQSITQTLTDMKHIVESGAFDNTPACIKFLISTLISLILAALGTLFGIVFGPLLALVEQVITALAILLAKIIAFLFDDTHTTA